MRENERLQIKRMLALIYRFIFILFGVWGICQHIGFNILRISFKIVNFTFLVDFLSLWLMPIIFVVSTRRRTGKVLQTIKNILTFCAIMIVVANWGMLGSTMTYQWILGILLPLMLIIDWILFDKKGSLNFYDPFLWLLGALLLIGLLTFLFNNILGIDNFLEAIGLFNNKDDLIHLLTKALGLGLLIFLIDSIMNALKKKSYKKTFALIYRLFFIALEIYAITHFVGT